jgi:MSHA biogenesis protein MshQ
LRAPDFTVPRIPGVYDDTWTAVDSDPTKNDCVAGSTAAAYSNSIDHNNTFATNPTYGMYGCNFGIAADTGAFGRFIPDHFDTVVNLVSGVPMPCPTNLPTGVSCPSLYNGFVYSGQPFDVSATAMNGLASPSKTLNYSAATGFSRNVTLSAWDALGSINTQNPGNGGIAGASISSGAFAAATAMINTSNYTFTTVPTKPTAIYIRATDADGVTSLRANNPTTTSIEGGVMVVSGRIKLSNAYGSELLPLTLTASAQYYAGATSGWVGSATDSVTALAFATSYAVGSGTTAVTLTPATSVLAAGNLTILLGKPSAGAGEATINPTAPAYLPVISGTATFGVYKNNSNFIYRRER